MANSFIDDARAFATMYQPQAIVALKQLLSLPLLGYIPIFSDSFIVERSAEISTQMLISNELDGGKQFVTDNIAPMPRVWTVKGYLRGIPYVELSHWFMPSLLVQKLFLETQYLSRRALMFRTVDGELVDVLIKRLSFINSPDNASTVQLEFTVQELNVLTILSSVVGSQMNNSQPVIGSVPGKVGDIGQAQSVQWKGVFP